MTHLSQIRNKIINSEERLNKLIKELQSTDGKIVFTNGCFDILHRGHIEYLSKAADLGNLMIIGLNTDDSVRRLKGSHRPIQDENSRAYTMAALSFIDYVVYFNEDTPYELISKIQPDILVKGADYKVEDIVGYDVVMAKGGKVETIEFVPGYSTTAIETKIKSER